MQDTRRRSRSDAPRTVSPLTPQRPQCSVPESTWPTIHLAFYRAQPCSACSGASAEPMSLAMHLARRLASRRCGDQTRCTKVGRDADSIWPCSALGLAREKIWFPCGRAPPHQRELVREHTGYFLLPWGPGGSSDWIPAALALASPSAAADNPLMRKHERDSFDPRAHEERARQGGRECADQLFIPGGLQKLKQLLPLLTAGALRKERDTHRHERHRGDRQTLAVGRGLGGELHCRGRR
jgi:hypothetical protein